MRKFDLRAKADVQTYGLGIKEIWEVPEEKHKPGCVLSLKGAAWLRWLAGRPACLLFRGRELTSTRPTNTTAS